MLATKAPHPNCAYKWMRLHLDTEDPGRAGRLLRRDAGERARLRPHEQDREGARARHCTPTSRTSYFKTIKFWKTPLAHVRQRQERLRALRGVADTPGRRSPARRRLVTLVAAPEGRSTGGGPYLGGAVAPALAAGHAHALAAARVVPRDLPRLVGRDARHRVLERQPLHQQPPARLDLGQLPAAHSMLRSRRSSRARFIMAVLVTVADIIIAAALRLLHGPRRSAAGAQRALRRRCSCPCGRATWHASTPGS